MQYWIVYIYTLTNIQFACIHKHIILTYLYHTHIQDITMDWGLGTWHSHHFLLRDQLYFLPTTYYAAIVINFIMRLGWAFVISYQQPYIQQHFILLLGMYMCVFLYLFIYIYICVGLYVYIVYYIYMVYVWECILYCIVCYFICYVQSERYLLLLMPI